VFYDLDTPVTLSRLDEGHRVEYLPPQGLAGFDLVLSYTGGRALSELRERLGARRVAPLYGSVDPDVHRPARPQEEFAGDLSYLGTYAEDRQDTLTRLFVEAARQRPDMRFVMGGAQYPQEFPWTGNIFFVRHLPPSQHPAFYVSSRVTLNVTRRAMADMGYCPSGRLFEAAACGAPVASDAWEGIEHFYEPGSEVILCRDTEDVLTALERSEHELRRVAERARERTLSEHTAMHRARQLEAIFEQV
jgi:spore maturation protein CgeB